MFQRSGHFVFVIRGERVVDEAFDLGAARVELQRRVDMRVVGPVGAVFHAVRAGIDHADVRVVAALVVVAIAQHFVAICTGFRRALVCSLLVGFLPAGCFTPSLGTRLIGMEIEFGRGRLRLEFEIRRGGARLVGSDSIDRPTAAAPLPDHAVGHERVLDFRIGVVAQLVARIAQCLLHGLVADARAIGRQHIQQLRPRRRAPLRIAHIAL
ncbi:hypothetical protein ACS8Y6_14395 [Salinisphaera sp. RV14]|uniref:hypothetical protein n=1 Tax=Salinisphaera sp. RV14 TaxID=3454140 RepID=UPI003F8549E4